MTKLISRRKLFKQLSLFITIPISLLWYSGSKKLVATSKKRKVVIPKDLAEGITFLDNVIIKKDSKSIVAFSSKCTHLGCKINSIVEDKLVCPCHGSHFNFDGIPESGPATKSLQSLNIETDITSGDMVLYV